MAGSKHENRHAFNVLKLFCEDHKNILKALRIQCAAAVLCPISVVSADVEEYVMEDYEMYEYYVLKLYSLGYTSAKKISRLTGLKENMVNKLLKTEREIYDHIDIATGEVTALGWKTLTEEADENGKYIQHMIYHTQRKLQVEAVTGSVIPGYMEDTYNEGRIIIADGNMFQPRKEIEMTETLMKEINTRLLEYKQKDIIKDADFIKKIENLKAGTMFFREVPVIQLDGMKYPMMVLGGRRTSDNINVDSKAERKKDMKQVARILSVSETDEKKLLANGFDTSGLLVREDHHFDKLAEEFKALSYDLDVSPLLEEESDDTAFAW